MAAHYKTPEGEAAFVAAYEAMLRSWPVAYDEIEVPCRWDKINCVADLYLVIQFPMPRPDIRFVCLDTDDARLPILGIWIMTAAP